ncbi:YlaI family protein [Rossellomorea sp. BNER]|uniref:YlaI family protein n=1 Tax=Rossellomorea sp. BNER TaxID=2962031 RepID=UPI003AF1F9E2|nr:YlaI family protein [Rossellomorea sp. BNER]
MRVKCILCETIEKIDDESVLAKRLRNRPIHTFMCENCSERIANKTNARIATGNFKLYRSPKVEHDF